MLYIPIGPAVFTVSITIPNHKTDEKEKIGNFNSNTASCCHSIRFLSLPRQYYSSQGVAFFSKFQKGYHSYWGNCSSLLGLSINTDILCVIWFRQPAFLQCYTGYFPAGDEANKCSETKSLCSEKHFLHLQLQKLLFVATNK